MATAETLKAARARIEKGWCRGAYARDWKGEEIDPRSPGAVKWCTFGALLPDPADPVITAADQALIDAADNEMLGDWNDAEERTRADVLDLYDRAIKIAESAAPEKAVAP